MGELPSTPTDMEQIRFRYQTLLNASMDGFWMADLQGHLLEVSPSYSAIAGYPTEELLTLTLADLTIQETPGAMARGIRAIVDAGARRFEVRQRRKDGSEITVEVSAHYLPEGEGRIFGFIRDITERKRSERFLRIQHDLSMALARTSDLQVALQDILDAMLQLDSLDCGGVYLVDEHTGAVDLVVQRNLSPTFLAERSHYHAGSREAQMIRAGRTEFRSYTGPRPPIGAYMDAEGIRAVALFPIVHDEQTIAVMNLASRHSDDIPAFDRSALETLAAQFQSALVRIQTEAKLRATQAFFDKVVSVAPLGISVHNATNGNVEFSNQRSYMAGLKAEDFKGLPNEERDRRVGEEERNRMQGFMRQLCTLADDEVRMIEVQGNRPDGSPTWSRHYFTVFGHDGAGKINRILCINEDITESKRLEAELRASETRLRQLMATTAVIIYSGRRASPDAPAFVSTFVSENVEERMGYRPEEIIGDTDEWFGRVHPEDWGLLLAGTRELTEKGETVIEYRYRHKDVSYRWLHDHMRLVGRPNDPDAELVGSWFDITDRKEAEAALAASERRQREIIDNSPDPIVVLDAAGKVVAWNLAMQQLTGVRAEEVNREGKFAAGLAFYGVRRPLLADFILRRDLNPQEYYEIAQWEDDSLVAEATLASLNGRTVRLWAKASPLYDAECRLVGAVEVLRDITDRVRAEQERLDLERQMQQAQKLESLGVMAGGVAHDFNNLLTTIMGNADLALLDGDTSAEVQESLCAIMASSRRAADLCKQLLAYSGKGAFMVELLDLRAAARQVEPILNAALPKSVRTETRYAERLPLIWADAGQMRQVIFNLMVNAGEAIGNAEGRVTVTIGQEFTSQSFLRECQAGADLPAGEYIFLEVADTGCGMAPDVLTRIFEPFFTTKFTGRGLGLSAVLGIVRGHQGAIKIVSEVGRGTVVRVLLPATDVFGSDAAVGRGRTERSTAEGVILLVEDEEEVLHISKRMLEYLGMRVLTAGDGAEALQVYHREERTLTGVLLDLSMPRMDGLETLRALLAMDPHARVILCSGYDEGELAERFAGEGAIAFLQKPYTLDTLREKLARLKPAP